MVRAALMRVVTPCWKAMLLLLFFTTLNHKFMIRGLMEKGIQSVYLPQKLRQRVKVKAAKEQTTISGVVGQLLEMWVKGEVKLEPESLPGREPA